MGFAPEELVIVSDVGNFNPDMDYVTVAPTKSGKEQ